MSAVQQQNQQAAQSANPVVEEKTVSKVQRIVTLGLFWGAFLSFLAVSIPHVAWLYQTYEPKSDGNWYTVGTTYGVAVGIDVMIAWLSWVQVAGKGVKSGITWVFIGALSLLSWYANYLYGMNNNPIHQADIWNISLLFDWTTTGYITPVIISAVPLFSLAYTAMLHTVMNQQVETVAEMRLRLADLQERKIVEKELKAAKGGGFKVAVLGTIQTGKDIVTESKRIVHEDETQESVSSDTQQDTKLNTANSLLVEETVTTQLEEQIAVYSFLEDETINETPEKLFPVIEDEEDETELYLDDEPEDEVFESGHTTDPLPIVEPEHNLNETDNITFLHTASATKSETNARAKSTRGAAAKRAANVMKKYPDITPMDLSKKAKITPTYARKLLAQWATDNETISELKS